jgi:hypothetical protein
MAFSRKNWEQANDSQGAVVAGNSLFPLFPVYRPFTKHDVAPSVRALGRPGMESDLTSGATPATLRGIVSSRAQKP